MGSLFTLGGDTVSSPADPAEIPDALPAPEMPALIVGRYERLEPLGAGGMGEVWRYRDVLLGRTVAIKAVRAERAGARALRRFEDEARITAQLQHPGILPVHDLGCLDDGRLWFAMKEVRGRTLEALFAEAHVAWRDGSDEASGLTFRRMLEVFLRVCETVAYAHARGVIHRDLKPSNVMVGGFGEVLVLDWGLAGLGAAGADEPVELRGGERLTSAGSVAGTPAYMAPEQARGETAAVGPAADVYALGAVLYELLCGSPPRRGGGAADLLQRAAEPQPVRPPSEVRGRALVDDELDRICLRALAADADARHPDAGALAAELARWLDGARRREQALALVDEAGARMAEAAAAEAEEAALSARAERALAALPATATAADKQPAWALEDEAARQLDAASAARTRAVQLLRSALSHAPELASAHDRLADHFQREHAQLEARNEARRAAAALADLAEHDRSRRYASYIRGTGAVTLVTDPPGAIVRLHRYVEEGRRLVPRFERALGITPLAAAPVEMGSYLLTLRRDGHDDVNYPILVRRQEHMDGVPPGEGEPLPVRLPRQGELGPDDCYTPAGWCWVGDDEFPTTLPLERVWVGPLVVRRFPVTLEEYTAFLNDLVDRGEPDRADALEPQLVEGGGPFLERDAAGRFAGIRSDMEGELWYVLRASARLPVVYVDLHQARAYAAWASERDGSGWRIPTEIEWQRAGRGADLRSYPWGDHFEWSWTRCRPPVGQPHIVSVDAFPHDRSPFGVRGMAGNVAEWGADRDGSSFNLGGSCASGPLSCRLTYRSQQAPGFRLGKLGFRLVRDLR